MKQISFFLTAILAIYFTVGHAQEPAFTVDFTGALKVIHLPESSQTNVGPIAPSFGGMDFGPNNVLYGLDYNTNQLYSVDTSDASTTLIGSSTPPSTHIWTGMAFDPATGIMYANASHGIAAGSSNLYTIDLTDGSITLVGSQTDVTAFGCIAIDGDGQMYGLRLVASADIYTIDKTDGSVEYLGEVNGFGGAGMGYGMDWNAADETMYLTAYNSLGGSNDLYTINLSTGAATQVGSLPVWTFALAIINPFQSGFSADETLVCAGTTVNFSDESVGAESWEWSFEGGTPSTSTEQNPSVEYLNGGVFDVELTITGTLGQETSLFLPGYITVLEIPVQANVPEGDEALCSNLFYYYSIDEIPYAENYEWVLDPVDAGTFTYDMNLATLETSDDWSGDFTLKARATNMCGEGEWSDNFDGTVSISPNAYDLEGGGEYCNNGEGVEITLSDSDNDINYELYFEGEATGNIIQGTGSAISFGLLTEEGSYSALASNDNCDAEMFNQIDVTIIYAPIEPETPVGPTDVCNAATSEYSSNGSDDAESYEWMLSPEEAGTLTPNGLAAAVEWSSEFTGTAMVSISGTNECGVGNPSNLDVMVGSLAAPLILGAEMVCEEQVEEYMVTDNPNNTYEWTVDGGTITDGLGTSIVTIEWGLPGTGIITVIEENEIGCLGTSNDFEVIIDDCTGIDENSPENSVRLQPNPAKDYVNIQSGNNIQAVQVYNLTGELVLNKTMNSTEDRINLAEYQAGIYLIRIVTDKGIVTKRLIVE